MWHVARQDKKLHLAQPAWLFRCFIHRMDQFHASQCAHSNQIPGTVSWALRAWKHAQHAPSAGGINSGLSGSPSSEPIVVHRQALPGPGKPPCPSRAQARALLWSLCPAVCSPPTRSWCFGSRVLFSRPMSKPQSQVWLWPAWCASQHSIYSLSCTYGRVRLQPCLRLSTGALVLREANAALTGLSPLPVLGICALAKLTSARV